MWPLVCLLQEWTSKANFTHHAHTASISAVATSERFVVTGSKDETIQLYDMKKRTEHGSLLHHDGEYLCYRPTVHKTTEDNSVCFYFFHNNNQTWMCVDDKGVCIVLISFLMHRHHLLPWVLWIISPAEWRRRWTPVCVEHQEVGVSEVHQSSPVGTEQVEIKQRRVFYDCCKVMFFFPLFLRGHVTSLSVHPSGKLALSVGTDKTLR